MKLKYLFITLICLLLVPFNVFADEEKIYTTITGSNLIQNGQRVEYTVIVDNKLTEYDATINYDKNLLNLVSVDEKKIDTEVKNIEIEKKDFINIKISSEEPAIIIYTIVFDVKSTKELSDTVLTIKTNSAKCKTKEKTYDYAAIDTEYKIYVNEPGIQYEELEEEQTSIVDNYISKIKNMFDNNYSIIILISLILNLILFISLIVSIKRKKMDYDF